MFSSKNFIVVFIVLAILIFIASVGAIFETNNRGYVQVKQAIISGKMTCKLEPGTYAQMFGDINTYNIADMYYFSKHKEEGGSGLDSAPIQATFSGRSTALISGTLKYELPELNCDKLIAIDSKYRSNARLKEELIRQYVTEVITQTAPLFNAEEADAPKRDQFREIAYRQLKHGIYKKVSKIEYITDPADPQKKIARPVTELALDSEGNPIIAEPSPFIDWGITIISFTIKDLEWDDVTTKLLTEKKQIDMTRTLAKASAVTAQQNAIKEKAEGDAREAKARADANVAKTTAVIEEQKLKEVAVLRAQKKYEMEKYAALEALERAKKIKAEGMANAAANAALVKAGLTPIERANIQMKTAIGVAEQLAHTEFPKIMVFGQGNATNPLEAVGYNQMFDLVKKLSNQEEEAK